MTSDRVEAPQEPLAIRRSPRRSHSVNQDRDPVADLRKRRKKDWEPDYYGLGGSDPDFHPRLMR